MPVLKKNSPVASPHVKADDIDAFLYTPGEGKKALAALGARLAAIPVHEVDVIRVDVEAAAYAALGVARFVRSGGVHERFAELPARSFDLRDLDDLRALCVATLSAHTEAQAAGGLETDAKISPSLVAEAMEVEKRMQTVCEYLLGDDPEIGPELDRLRPGSGHRDLLGDLKGYIRVYELRSAVVKTDPKNYRPGDLRRAQELVAQLGQALSEGMTPRAREAHDTLARCWTLLQRSYREVREAGLWLFRDDPLREQRFPSLFAAARPNVGRPRRPRAADTPSSSASPTPDAATP